MKAQQERLANITLRGQIEAGVRLEPGPIVGQQVTLWGASGADAQARALLLEARAAAGECDLVVRSLDRDADGRLDGDEVTSRPD